MESTGNSALVTGGAGGLGSATARRLLQKGFSVVLLDTDGDRLEGLATELGSRVVAIAGDHTAEATVRQAISAAQALGRFAVCVNAAGTVLATPLTADVNGTPHDMGLFEAMVEMHLYGPFNVARLSAAAFAANEPDADGQRGVIVNTASTAAFEGQAGQAAYAAAKGAIASMTAPMARDLAPIGVRVCAIAPGPIITPRLASAPEALQQRLIANVAFPKRLGRPEEYALLVEAIVRNPFLNGQVIRLDGAMSTPLAAFMPAR